VRPRERTSLTSFVSVAEAPGLPVGVSDKRSIPEHIGKPQALRLPPIEDGLHDIRRQASQWQEPADVGSVTPSCSARSMIDFARPLSLFRRQRCAHERLDLGATVSYGRCRESPEPFPRRGVRTLLRSTYGRYLLLACSRFMPERLRERSPLAGARIPTIAQRALISRQG
jgi:hypothetical protein